MGEVTRLLTARWGSFSGLVPDKLMLPKSFVAPQRDFGGAAVAISGVRTLADYGMLAAVLGKPAVKQLNARDPRSPLVPRPFCRVSKLRCSLLSAGE